MRDHLLNAHYVDPRGSTYAYYVQNVDVYPPIAKGFAMVKAGIPNGQPKDVCVDTGSSISLIDTAFAKELYLDLQYTRIMHLRGIGNQRTTTYVKFPIYIAGIEVWVTAYVIYVKSIRVILGMDILRANQIDVLTSKDLLKIKDKEVPLRYAAALTN